ncbi:hypothetical protein, partial [Stenotrophomonas sp. CASM106]|uniref:hypothetical protein n=1 Tax=Stenotrophomonas sp. CASM106 TaxID=3111508 RepID=UPI003BF85346
VVGRGLVAGPSEDLLEDLSSPGVGPRSAGKGPDPIRQRHPRMCGSQRPEKMNDFSHITLA